MTEVNKGILTNPIYFNSTVKMLDNAHILRKNETYCEKLLWQELRNCKLKGLKFRRQHAIDRFVADFYCNELKLIVELDGNVHELLEQKVRDEDRTLEFMKLGLKVVRITNEEVLEDISTALEKILRVIK
jgi:very-short-patch-repair endonuclease